MRFVDLYDLFDGLRDQMTIRSTKVDMRSGQGLRSVALSKITRGIAERPWGKPKSPQTLNLIPC